MLSDKEAIVLEDKEDGNAGSRIAAIIKAALNTQAKEQERKEPARIRFNDLSTADLIVRVMPDGPILCLNKSIVEANLLFASFRNFAEANGYAEITAPDPETCAFVIEFLYHFSTDEPFKFEEEMFGGCCFEWVVKRKFIGVLRNASFFMMDHLLFHCYSIYLYGF
jgi:hypothetical protein